MKNKRRKRKKRRRRSMRRNNKKRNRRKRGRIKRRKRERWRKRRTMYCCQSMPSMSMCLSDAERGNLFNDMSVCRHGNC